MGTPSSLIHLAFAGALDESQADELLDPMSALPIKVNCRQDRYGAVNKRLGFAALAATRLDGTTRSAGRRLFCNGDQLCTYDGSQIDIHVAGLDRSVAKGRIPEATCRLLDAPSAGAGTRTEVMDLVVCNGFAVVSYAVYDSTGATQSHVAVVLDTATGAVVRGPELVTGGSTNLGSFSQARLATYSTYVIAIGSDTSGTTAIKASYINLASAATITTGWVAIGNVATDYDDVRQSLDVGSFSDRIALAYVNTSAGTQRVTIKTITIAGVVATANPTTANSLHSNVGVSEGGSILWVTWANSSPQTVAIAYTVSTLAVAGTATQISAASLGVVYVVYESATTASVYAWGGSAASAFTMQPVQISGGAVATNGLAVSIYNAKPQGRPFLYGSRVYLPMSSSNKAEMVLCDVTTDRTGASVTATYLRPVASPIQRELLFDVSTAERRARSAALATASRLWFPFSRQQTASTAGAAIAEWDFARVDAWKAAAVGNATYLSGGVLTVFDGSRPFEAAFLSAPPTPSFDTTQAGTLTLTNGGRRYVLTWEEVDADGNWHLSGTSTPTDATGNIASKKVVLTIRPISITARGASVGINGTSLRVVVWATSDGGSTYRRCGEVANNPNTASLSFTDQVAETTLATRPMLYGTGSLPGTGAGQDHRAPPGFSHIVAYNGMIVGAFGSVLYYSSQPVDGEGQWWNPVFVMAGTIDGEVTGLAVQDGSVVVFTRRGVWVTAGDPPADNGASGGLATPRKLAVDQGCTNANGIVTTNLGTFYLSDRGIELLTRGQTNEFIGDKVARTLDTYPVMMSAVLDARNSLVRFSLAASISSGVVSGEGRSLVFDLTTKRWESVDDITGSSAHQPAQDAATVLVDGVWRYAWIASDGIVYYERLSSDASAYLDGSTWIGRTVETGVFKTGGLQGRQILNAVQLLTRKDTDHDLSLSLSYDYATTFQAARTWTRTEINALLTAGWPITQLKHFAHNDAECQGVRLRLTDATPTGGTVGSGKASSWLGFTLDIVPKDGAFDVPEEAA